MFGSGSLHHKWNGGRKKHPEGYVYVLKKGHPRSTKDGYVLEHILVMEEYLGRPLKYFGQNHPDNEIVHHLNEIKDDNRIENLVVVLRKCHIKHHCKIPSSIKEEVFKTWSFGIKNHDFLSKKFGISRSHIGNILLEKKREAFGSTTK